MPTTPVPQPFTSDAELVAAVCSYLRARCHRLAAQQDADTTKDSDLTARSGRPLSRDHRCEALLAREEEDKLKAEMDARLQAHRADPMRMKLGIDRLTEDHGLSDDERLILLAAAVPGISQRVSEDVYRSLSCGYGLISVTDTILLLDPRGVTDWLRFRKLFHRNSPLCKAGLIIIDQPENVTPDSLPQADVRLSMTAFATIVGDPAAATEIDPKEKL